MQCIFLPYPCATEKTCISLDPKNSVSTVFRWSLGWVLTGSLWLRVPQGCNRRLLPFMFLNADKNYSKSVASEKMIGNTALAHSWRRKTAATETLKWMHLAPQRKFVRPSRILWTKSCFQCPKIVTGTCRCRPILIRSWTQGKRKPDLHLDSWVSDENQALCPDLSKELCFWFAWRNGCRQPKNGTVKRPARLRYHTKTCHLLVSTALCSLMFT